jgi:mono/diheme cytochrome c family protein
MLIKSLTLTVCLATVFGFALIDAGAAEKKAVDLTKLPPVADAKDVSYQQDIQPMFQKTCFKCHGPEKQKGKLRVDSLEATLKGGQDGKVVEPGNSAKSVLVQNVARIGEEDDYMPPVDKGEPLTKAQVGLIRAWIDQGAK